MRMIGAVVANKRAEAAVANSNFSLNLPLGQFQRLYSNVSQGDHVEKARVDLGQVNRIDPSIEENKHPMRTNHLLDEPVEIGLRDPPVRLLKRRKME